MSWGVQQALWMQSWLDEVDMGLGAKPLNIFCYNLRAISLLETTKSHNLSKHIDIRHLFIQEFISRGRIAVHPMSSLQNITDLDSTSWS